MDLHNQNTKFAAGRGAPHPKGMTGQKVYAAAGGVSRKNAMQNQWIAVIDNGGDAVPKREEWRTVTAPSAQEAAFEYVSQHVNMQGPGEQTLKILVIMLSQYNMAEGWAGCLVHSFNATLRKEDPDQVARDLEAKRAARLERLEDLAAAARDNSAELGARARRMADVIPLGQPILIGHHSEGRDRRYRGRIENTFRKSFEESEKAEYYQRKAQAAENNTAIYSDDPDATDKLGQKIAEAKQLQIVMVATNKLIRRTAKAGAEAQRKALADYFTEQGLFKGEEEAKAAELLRPHFAGRIGFPSYALTNNSANIRRMEERRRTVAQNQAKPAVALEGEHARYEHDPAANRIRLFFPGKPAEAVRDRLKAAGFRWAPSVGAWQAFRTWRAEQAGKAEAGIGEPVAIK